jgi:hypothetical protein
MLFTQQNVSADERGRAKNAIRADTSILHNLPVRERFPALIPRFRMKMKEIPPRRRDGLGGLDSSSWELSVVWDQLSAGFQKCL